MKPIKKISKVMPLSLKVWLVSRFRQKNIQLSSKKRAFIFLAADYGNIGDLAITQAQQNFLHHNLADYEVISIPISQTRLVLSSIKKQINPEDIVTLIGGGNMGVAYPDIEALRQKVIVSFPNNRIVCFPQTLDWEETKPAKRFLKSIVKSYSKHNDIHVFARESISYKKLTGLFEAHDNVTVGLVPDIVMSTTAKELGVGKSNPATASTPHILQCLRDDKEAVLTDSQYETVIHALNASGLSVIKTDTHAGGSSLDQKYCTKLLVDKLTQFHLAEMVITDRLHGMIMCLLVGTPCLVLPNSNHKISQTYLDWLQGHPRVMYVHPDHLENIEILIPQLLMTEPGKISDSPLSTDKYNPLKEALSQ